MQQGLRFSCCFSNFTCDDRQPKGINDEHMRMKKRICQLAVILAVTSLAGCGLKGPLYFPKDEQAKPQTTQTTPATQSGNQAQQPATTSGQSVQPAQ